MLRVFCLSRITETMVNYSGERVVAWPVSEGVDRRKLCDTGGLVVSLRSRFEQDAIVRSMKRRRWCTAGNDGTLLEFRAT